jgi:putative SOS response-associated peptidase YedK
MCGRFSLTTVQDAMQALFGFDNLPNLPPRYNIAPTQQVAVVRTGDSAQIGDAGSGLARELVMMRWGLIPHWAKDAAMGSKMINARAETVAEKPSFREAVKSRRCLVPADGFYEWRMEDGHKQPFRIGMRGGPPFAFAGLWDSWTAKSTAAGLTEGEVVETVTIVTTVANKKLQPIHARMPVILPPEAFDGWLDLANDPAAACTLLKPYPAESMAFYRVSQAVNNVRNDDPSCTAPLTAA